MSSKYEKTQGTKISISKLPATEANPASAEFLPLACAAKEIGYTGGQKSDIDVTTLCSTEQEMTNGLASPGRSQFLVTGHRMRGRKRCVLPMTMTRSMRSKWSFRQVMVMPSWQKSVRTAGVWQPAG